MTRGNRVNPTEIARRWMDQALDEPFGSDALRIRVQVAQAFALIALAQAADKIAAALERKVRV